MSRINTPCRLGLTGLVVSICLLPNVSSAGEIDILVRKLAEKNVITYGEAQQLMTSSQEEVKKQLIQGKLGSVPAWAQNISFKGDLRLRHQTASLEGSKPRNRERIRFRLGSTARVVDNVNVGFGLATGSDDPRSTNQTLENNFQTPDIRLDYAFAEYALNDSVTFFGGKFKNPLENVSDLLWDSDINTEGVAVKYTGGSSPFAFFANAGYFMLDEASGTVSDPYLVALQPGFSYTINESMQLTGLATLYNFQHVKGATLNKSSGTNTLSGGGLANEFNPVEVAARFSISEPVSFLEDLSLIAQYVKNPNPSEKNQGYLYGVQFGNKKIGNFGDWQFKYFNRKLQADAWVDALPDSDAYEGATDMEGSEFILEYGLMPNVAIGLDYYRSANLTGAETAEDLLQVDLVTKF